LKIGTTATFPIPLLMLAFVVIVCRYRLPCIQGWNYRLVIEYRFVSSFLLSNIDLSLLFTMYFQPCLHLSFCDTLFFRYTLIISPDLWTSDCWLLSLRKVSSHPSPREWARVAPYTAFTLNGFDDQEQNLTFVETDFQVLKLKLYVCNFKQTFYPLHNLYIAWLWQHRNTFIKAFRSIPSCQNLYV